MGKPEIFKYYLTNLDYEHLFVMSQNTDFSDVLTRRIKKSNDEGSEVMIFAAPRGSNAKEEIEKFLQERYG
jgi:predicted CopG family antitoxin